MYAPYHYLSIPERKPGAIRNGVPFKNRELPQVFRKYRKLLNDKYKDGDIYYARTLILLKDWSMDEIVEAIESCINAGILGDGYVLSLLRKKTEPAEPDEQISLRIELTKYKSDQRPLKDYDIILRLKKGEQSDEQTEPNNGILKRSQTGRIQDCIIRLEELIKKLDVITTTSTFLYTSFISKTLLLFS